MIEEQEFIPTLFLIRGVPGSARGLVASKLAHDPYGNTKMPVYSSDDFFMKDGEYKFDGDRLREAHIWCQEQVEQSMNEGILKIFVSNTFVEDWELSPYYLLAKRYRYMVHCLIVENRHHGVTDKIPRHSSDRMRDKFSISL